MRVLAVDQGTSATKACVVEAEGPGGGNVRVLAEVDVPVFGRHHAGDAVEQDPQGIWDSLVEAGRRALAEAGRPPVAAVGVGNQGETVLAWNRRTGEPLTTALSWQDRRAAVVTERLAAAGRADHLHALTGLPLDPYFAAPKMAWLVENLLPEDAAADPDTVVTTLDAWVLHRLTGRAVTDAATASRTGLLDLDAVAWSPEATATYGLDPGRLPEVVACDAVLGRTTVFGPDLPVAGAIVDQQAALLAEGCTEPGDAKCTYGTGAFLLAQVGLTPTRSTSGLATSVAWQGARRTHYCLDGQVYSVGAAISWLQRLGMIDEPTDLDRLGLAVPDAGGATFVPALAGLGAPVWRPDARAALSGLALGTTREHVVRAVVDGVAAQVTQLARAVEADLGRPLRSLRVDGGLTRSRLLLQTQADLLGLPVEVYPHACATALGVAALTYNALGELGAAEAVVHGWEPVAVVEPGQDTAHAADRYEAWLRAVAAVLDRPSDGPG